MPSARRHATRRRQFELRGWTKVGEWFGTKTSNGAYEQSENADDVGVKVEQEQLLEQLNAKRGERGVTEQRRDERVQRRERDATLAQRARHDAGNVETIADEHDLGLAQQRRRRGEQRDEVKVGLPGGVGVARQQPHGRKQRDDVGARARLAGAAQRRHEHDEIDATKGRSLRVRLSDDVLFGGHGCFRQQRREQTQLVRSGGM